MADRGVRRACQALAAVCGVGDARGVSLPLGAASAAATIRAGDDGPHTAGCQRKPAGNDTPEALAAELERIDADVYFLQELSPEWDDQFERLGFWRRYPFNRRINGEDAFGAAIAARVPVHDLEVFWSADLPQVRGVLRLDDRDVELVNIHLLPPRTLDYTGYYHKGAEALLDIVRRFGSRSFIVAGDFNSTPDSDFATRMRDLADDAWEASGRGFGFTWPNGMFQVPPIRLDHVFVSRDLGVLGARVGEGAGSDHRPVVADLARRAAFAR